MRVTKFGHCCVLIEHKDVRILTDPGSYSKQDTVSDIDIVLITHEHGDHLHVESLKGVLQRSPNAIVVTNNGVGKVLEKEGIGFQVVTDGMRATLCDILLEAFGTAHAEIYESFGAVENTGYLIDETLFYPGDAFTIPPKAVRILALPVAGPWMRLSDAVRYALEVKPTHAFPVHDGMLIPGRGNLTRTVPAAVFPKHGITFHPLADGEQVTF